MGVGGVQETGVEGEISRRGESRGRSKSGSGQRQFIRGGRIGTREL